MTTDDHDLESDDSEIIIIMNASWPGTCPSRLVTTRTLAVYLASVTVVCLIFVTGGRMDEGRLAKLGAGLIEPLCRRDGHGRPGPANTSRASKGQQHSTLAKRLLAPGELRSGGSRLPAVRLLALTSADPIQRRGTVGPPCVCVYYCRT